MELITHTIEKTLKKDQNLLSFAAIAAHKEILKADDLRDHDKKA